MKRNANRRTLGVLIVAFALAMAPILPSTFAQGEEPDLVPLNIEFEPKDPQAGDLVTFTTTVANQGNASAGPFSVEFAVDGTIVSIEAVAGIDANQTANVTSDPWPAAEGDHTVTVTVDAAGTVSESDEENNVRERNLTILPDLVPHDMAAEPSEPDQGEETVFNVTVTNEGDATAESFDVTFAVDGENLSTTNVAGTIEPGASVDVESDAWNATLGAHTVTATVDSDNETEESDETNNQAQLAVALGANLIVTTIEPVPAATQPGDDAVFTATIANEGHTTAQNFRVAFNLTAADSDLALVAVGNLAPNDEITVSSEPWQASEGVFALTVTADPNDVVPETDEDDNDLTRTIAVGEENLPDLSLRAVAVSPSVPEPGQEATFEATVVNEGGSEADPFAVQFGLGERGTIDEAIVAEGLAPGESTSVESDPVEMNVTGQHVLRVTADPAGAVPESNTENNEVVETFTVTSQGEPAESPSPTPTEDTPGLGVALTIAAIAFVAGAAGRRR